MTEAQNRIPFDGGPYDKMVWMMPGEPPTRLRFEIKRTNDQEGVVVEYVEYVLDTGLEEEVYLCAVVGEERRHHE